MGGLLGLAAAVTLALPSAGLAVVSLADDGIARLGKFSAVFLDALQLAFGRFALAAATMEDRIPGALKASLGKALLVVL